MLFHPTRFWNLIARRYARKPVDNPDAYQHKLNVTAGYLTPEGRLLEFGCGTGTTALIHAPKVSHIDAIDFSSEMIAIAREKAVAQNIGNVSFETASFENWPLPDGEGYDGVLGMSILHLVPNIDDTLAKTYKSLKHNGLFFSSTVCIKEMGGLIRYVLPPLGALGILPKILPLTSNMLIERIKSHGFVIEDVWYLGKKTSVFIVARKT